MPPFHFEPNTWQFLYAQACHESDPDKLTKLVIDVEEAVYLRQQQLSNSDSDRNERRAMKVACDGLLLIKTKRLGWPGIVRKNQPHMQ
ncbi:MAG: hypothetical protein WA823_09530 [Candidatus Acidiferrales bacterium]